MQKTERIYYDEVIDSSTSTFDITVKCKQCGSTDCFIGIKNGPLVSINLDLVCPSCGHIEMYC